MRVYIDTSAYVALLIPESAAPQVRALVEGAEMCSSSLLILEAHRNLVRLARERRLKPVDLQDALERVRRDRERLTLKDLSLDLCTDPRLPVLSTPKSLDLAHLQTALWFQKQAPLERFVSLDESQIQAARELGLPV